MIRLIGRMPRCAEGVGDADGARELDDAGRPVNVMDKGSLTVVVALERS